MGTVGCVDVKQVIRAGRWQAVVTASTGRRVRRHQLDLANHHLFQGMLISPGRAKGPRRQLSCPKVPATALLPETVLAETRQTALRETRGLCRGDRQSLYSMRYSVGQPPAYLHSSEHHSIGIPVVARSCLLLVPEMQRLGLEPED